MKFVLFVEGHTERAAVPALLKRCIDPDLSQPVGINVVRFEGWNQFYKEIAKKAALHLNSPSADKIIAAIGLLDLYGPDIYPSHLTSPQQKSDWGVQEIQGRVAHPKFRMYFAHHEVEAWLLSDPSVFPSEIRSAIQAKSKTPERVNFNEPPSKLLQKLYSAKVGRDYKKLTYGKDLFDRIDHEKVREKCPYFKQMVDDMLTLAREAGL